MTSENLKFVQQTFYNGGIQAQPEEAKPNQVLDASNYWTPLSRCDRRPGIGTLIALQGAVFGGGTSNNLVMSIASANIGATCTGTSSTFTPGAGYCGIQISLSGFFTGNIAVNAAYSQVIVAWQVYTTRGWVGTTGFTDVDAARWPLEVLPLTANTAVATTLNIALPNDTKLEPGTNALIRFVITGAVTAGGAFVSVGGPVLTTFTNTTNTAPFLTLAASTQQAFRGAHRSQMASGVWPTLVRATASATQHFLIISAANNFNSDKAIKTTTFTLPTNQIQGPPSTTAVIPAFNTSYVAVDHTIYEFPYNQQASVAQVNQDPLIVGPTNIAAGTTSIYPSDQIPQMNTFPAANLIIYFKDRLWCADILGQPQTIQWAAAVDSVNGPSYNVWPSASQALLSDARDNSPITSIAALADNLVVFKKNSIWLMIDQGTDLNNLAIYEPRLVVAGVGCLAHNSVRAIPGGLVFLAEDGFYLFDGTPNIKRISDPVKNYISRISPARAPFAQAINWRTQQYYLCATSLDGEMNSNNYVFCYDYQSGAWWMWTGWDVQCWYQDDGVGLKEEVWFFDRYGRASKLMAGDTDNGTPITCYLLTERFGEFDILSKDIREVRIQSSNQADVLAPITIDVVTDDIMTTEGANHAVNLPLDGETLWSDPPVSGTSTWATERRRERKIPVRVTGKWFQVKVKNALQVIFLACGYLPDSRR